MKMTDVFLLYSQLPLTRMSKGIKKNSLSFDSSSYPGINYEEVLVQGDSVLVRDSESSSYPGSELSRFNCTLIIMETKENRMECVVQL